MSDDSWGDVDVSAIPAHLTGIDVWVEDGAGARHGPCKKCGEVGHRSRDCWIPPCYKCGEQGHWSQDCPTNDTSAIMSDDSWGDVNATPTHLAGIDVSARDNTGARSGACFKCEEEGHRSRECPNNAGGSGGRRGACFRCGEEGHMGRECPNNAEGMWRTCFRCGEEGHTGRECPNNAGGSGGRRRACYKCGEEGHMGRECPNNAEARRKACFKCGEEGHVSRDCQTTEETKPATLYFGNLDREAAAANEDLIFLIFNQVQPVKRLKLKKSDGFGFVEFWRHQSAVIALQTLRNKEVFGKPMKLNWARSSNAILPHKPRNDDICRKRICSKCGEEDHFARECPYRGITVLKINNSSQHSASGSKVNPPPPSQPTSRLKTGSRLQLRNTSIITPPIHENGSSTVPFPSSGKDVVCCIGTEVDNSNGCYIYLFPILTALLRKKKNVLEPQSAATATTTAPNIPLSPEAVILVPVKQLVGYIGFKIHKLITGDVVDICSPDSFYGVVPVGETGCNILLTTISALEHLINGKNMDFKNVEFLVLEEANKLLTGYSVKAAELLVSNFSPKNQRTSVAIYRTRDLEKEDVLKVFLKDDRIFFSFGFGFNSFTSKVCQGITLVEGQDEGLEKIVKYLKRLQKDLLKTLLFCESTMQAYYLASQLSFRIPQFHCHAIHEQLHQWQKKQVLREFAHRKQSILIVSRDSAIYLRTAQSFPVNLIINFDLPVSIEEYVQRIGMSSGTMATNYAQFTIFVRESQEGDGCRRCRGQVFDECYDMTH